MIELKEKADCCGCTACVYSCPKSAISMVPDNEGFLYPEVNLNLCINCGICNKSCPVENKPLPIKRDIDSYVLRTRETEVLKNSTSGGFFTPLAIYVLEQWGGVICAASYDKDFKVEHTIIENEEGLFFARGSKYVQSSLGNCFVKIKTYLEQKRYVCFVGTPCQVNGLKLYLQKDYKRLITVDLVCHGISSPKLWDKYLNYQIHKYHSEIKEISFRNKTYGYHSGTMKICFANEKTYYGSGRVDYMLKSFFKGISSRPICYQCPFKDLNRCSDFTIYDCWHAEELVSGLSDDDKGYTNVIVQSEKGKRILRQISDRYELYQTDTNRAVELDGKMVRRSTVPHSKRFDFYMEIDKMTMPELAQKFIPISSKDKLIEKAKIVFYRAGIYQTVKKVLKNKLTKNL